MLLETAIQSNNITATVQYIDPSLDILDLESVILNEADQYNIIQNLIITCRDDFYNFISTVILLENITVIEFF